MNTNSISFPSVDSHLGKNKKQPAGLGTTSERTDPDLIGQLVSFFAKMCDDPKQLRNGFGVGIRARMPYSSAGKNP